MMQINAALESGRHSSDPKNLCSAALPAGLSSESGMNAIVNLLDAGWDLALGTWPLLTVAALLWAVMMLSAVRRVVARQPGGLTLALLAGGWAVAAALAVSPELGRATLDQPMAGLSLALLAGLVGFGLIRSRSALR